MITLQLNRDVYSIKCIEIARRAFKDYAKISLEKEKDYFLLSFSESIYDEKQTIQEFENYLIGLENS